MEQGKTLLFFIFFIISSWSVMAQSGKIEGKISDADGHPVSAATVSIPKIDKGILTNDSGYFSIENIAEGNWNVYISAIGFETRKEKIVISDNVTRTLNFKLKKRDATLNELVVTGTMKPIKKSESPVVVKSFSSQFFKKNASPDLFDALQNINGVRPQINCNVCNTGDIHINGLEGPYTMVLIDGMPIVSTLGSVYGFSGIPSSLIQRVEVVKGPASSLYGSEAMGGLINVITKKPENAALLSADISGTTWGEYNADLGISLKMGEKAHLLTGINYYNFRNIIDKDGDGFTDKTLQDRISIFQKWNFDRSYGRIFTLAARYYYEDRWGGETNWNKSYRGGDEVYGESIYTNRAAILGNYQLPTADRMFLKFSLINHDQNSRYGDESYIANQKIAYGQLTWNKMLGNHDILTGAALKYAYYDDNTPATATSHGKNDPEKIWLPGVFLQDDIHLGSGHDLLLGMRYDYNNIHGDVFTPRLAYKWTINSKNIFRLNTGTGYRVVHVFNEDHAALTGGKDVVLLEGLKPEKSYNVNLNYEKHLYTKKGNHIGVDGTAFYTYFTNRIVPDYDTDPTKIIYQNIHDGNAISKGLSIDLDMNFNFGLDVMIGGTWLHNTVTREGRTEREMKSESFNGTWTISYPIHPISLTVDYTGNLIGPMLLPIQGDLDPRPQYSPWFSIQNIQFTYDGFKDFEIYAGIKNLLNWTVGKAAKPFLIARPQDPFDQESGAFEPNGDPIVSPQNPFGLVFDPDSYSYGSNVGMRGILGVRFTLK